MCLFALRKAQSGYQLNQALSVWWPSQWRDSPFPSTHQLSFVSTIHLSSSPPLPPLSLLPSLSALTHAPSLPLFPPSFLCSLSLSVSQAAGNWMHKLLSPPPLTPTKSFPFSTLLSWDILFLHQICVPLIKLNYSWLPNIPCPDGCQHRNAWLWTCNDTAPTLKHELQPFPAPSTGRLPDTLGSWN